MNTQTIAPLNHLFPTVCPACDGVDRCDPDACICPTCYTTDPSVESMQEWRTFAPVLTELNARNVSWGWGTSASGKHSVEIGTTVDIIWSNGEFIVSGYERTAAATRLDQEQGRWIDVYCGPDAESAAAAAQDWAEGPE